MTRQKILILILLMIVPLVFFHCDEKAGEGEEMTTWKQEKQDLVDRVQAKINEIEAEIDRIREKKPGEETMEEMKEEVRQQVENLEDLRAEAEERLKELEASTADTWDEIRTKIRREWEKLQARIDPILNPSEEEEAPATEEEQHD